MRKKLQPLSVQHHLSYSRGPLLLVTSLSCSSNIFQSSTLLNLSEYLKDCITRKEGRERRRKRRKTREEQENEEGGSVEKEKKGSRRNLRCESLGVNEQRMDGEEQEGRRRKDEKYGRVRHAKIREGERNTWIWRTRTEEAQERKWRRKKDINEKRQRRSKKEKNMGTVV